MKNLQCKKYNIYNSVAQHIIVGLKALKIYLENAQIVRIHICLSGASQIGITGANMSYDNTYKTGNNLTFCSRRKRYYTKIWYLIHFFLLL